MKEEEEAAPRRCGEEEEEEEEEAAAVAPKKTHLDVMAAGVREEEAVAEASRRIRNLHHIY